MDLAVAGALASLGSFAEPDTVPGQATEKEILTIPRKFPQSGVESALREGADDKRKSRFTKAQTIWMMKEQEAGWPTAELCRKHDLSPAMFNKLKAKQDGMALSDTRRLMQLEEENAQPAS